MSPLELNMMTIQVMLEKLVRSITIAGTSGGNRERVW